MKNINPFSGIPTLGTRWMNVQLDKEGVEKYRQAQLKVERIWMQNEEGVTAKLLEMFNKFNDDVDIPENPDYADLMDALEFVYSDAKSEAMISALEEIAKEFGYTKEMDNEPPLNLILEDTWIARTKWDQFLEDIKNEYKTVGKLKKKLHRKLDGAYYIYELEKAGIRASGVERGQVWKAVTSISTGREMDGYRWCIVISNKEHAVSSKAVNIVFLTGAEIDKEKHTLKKMHPKYQIKITNDDLKSGALDEISYVNLSSINTMDKLRLLELHGEVSDDFMKKLMYRISVQLGITEPDEHTYDVEDADATDAEASASRKESPILTSDGRTPQLVVVDTQDEVADVDGTDEVNADADNTQSEDPADADITEKTE